jgi:aryl-alcohol dehydrogenase-like predicted oxidoreductase/histidinol phosphatase-like enzyme/predicted kinase
MWPRSLDIPLVALGAMRLSTESDRDDGRSIATLHAAFDAGVTLIDTADAYALNAKDTGHNERLIAQALSTWNADRARVTVMTKGGLTRPEGRWVPDGRARHLMAACHASREALGGSRIALYQLHAPDPRVAWTTSVRALAALKRADVVDAVGLCNVTVGQIEAARAVTEIAAVQVELSPWNNRSLAGGVVDYCEQHGIRLLGYRPFGGVRGAARVARDEVIGTIAQAREASPFEVVLAWIRGLGPHIVPLPGATREHTARSCGRAQLVVLSEAERATLDAHFRLGRIRTAPVVRGHRLTGRPSGLPVSPPGGDIVMVMGLPGAGKSTFAARLVAEGYERLNRDEAGGPLAAITSALAARLDAGASRIVLDNTYLSRASRSAVIEAAAAGGRAVRGVWLDTSVDDAQVNAVWRMVRAHGRLLMPDELRRTRDPAVFGPTAQFRAQRVLEPPHLSEGFASVDVVPFVRQHDAALTDRAVIMWCDGVLRRSKSGAPRPRAADDVEVMAGRREVLLRYLADGWKLLAISWEPEMTEQNADAADVEARLARLRAELALDIEFHYCPHGAGPPVCWCRKPLPGLGVLVIHRHQLDPAQCIYVGAGAQDPPFARRLGFQYRDVPSFFI